VTDDADHDVPVRGGMLSRRHIIIGAALTLTSGLAFARQPTAHAAVVPSETFESWVPDRFASWTVVASSGVVLPPPDELKDRLYDNLVTRVYRTPDGTHVMMLLAYNNKQDGVLQVHRPEVCYPVGGYMLSETQKISVPALDRTIPANVFTATGADRIEQVLYFTRLADSYPRSWSEQRLVVMRENLAGRIPDGILMRASILSSDRGEALKILKQFIAEFTAASPARMQELLVGKSA
jgi:EpsI family protein